MDCNNIQMPSTLSDHLRLAASKGLLDQVFGYLQAGATLDADQDGYSALHYAAFQGHVNVSKFLIEKGCNINIQDNNGYTALHHAASQGHVGVVEVLLENGCDIDLQNEHGNAAIHEAAWNGFSKILELLVKFDVNVSIVNKAGFTALHLSAQNGHNESTRVLLYASCDSDIKNNYGDTTLHTAARYGHAGVTRILISARAKLNDQNKNGDTALHIAAALKRRKIAKLLLQSGIDLSIRNKQNEMAVDVARRKDHEDIVTLIQAFCRSTKLVKNVNVKNDVCVNEGPLVIPDQDLPQKTDGKAEKGKRFLFFKKKKPKEKEKNPTRHGVVPQKDMTVSNVTIGEQPVQGFFSKYVPRAGVQYYRDLAGTVKQGPIGYTPTCNCLPTMPHLKRQLDDMPDNVCGPTSIQPTNQVRQEHRSQMNHRASVPAQALEKYTQDRLIDEEKMCQHQINERTNDCNNYYGPHGENMKSQIQNWLEQKLEGYGHCLDHHHDDLALPNENIFSEVHETANGRLFKSRSDETLSQSDNHSVRYRKRDFYESRQEAMQQIRAWQVPSYSRDRNMLKVHEKQATYYKNNNEPPKCSQSRHQVTVDQELTRQYPVEPKIEVRTWRKTNQQSMIADRSVGVTSYRNDINQCVQVNDGLNVRQINDSLRQVDDGLRRVDDALNVRRADDSLRRVDDGLKRVDDGLNVRRADDSLRRVDDGLRQVDDDLNVRRVDDGLRQEDNGLRRVDNGLNVQRVDNGLRRVDDGLNVRRVDDGLNVRRVDDGLNVRQVDNGLRQMDDALNVRQNNLKYWSSRPDNSTYITMTASTSERVIDRQAARTQSQAYQYSKNVTGQSYIITQSIPNSQQSNPYSGRVSNQTDHVLTVNKLDTKEVPQVLSDNIYDANLVQDSFVTASGDLNWDKYPTAQQNLTFIQRAKIYPPVNTGITIPNYRGSTSSDKFLMEQPKPTFTTFGYGDTNDAHAASIHSSEQIVDAVNNSAIDTQKSSTPRSNASCQSSNGYQDGKIPSTGNSAYSLPVSQTKFGLSQKSQDEIYTEMFTPKLNQKAHSHEELLETDINYAYRSESKECMVDSNDAPQQANTAQSLSGPNQQLSNAQAIKNMQSSINTVHPQNTSTPFSTQSSYTHSVSRPQVPPKPNNNIQSKSYPYMSSMKGNNMIQTSVHRDTYQHKDITRNVTVKADVHSVDVHYDPGTVAGFGNTITTNLEPRSKTSYQTYLTENHQYPNFSTENLLKRETSNTLRECSPIVCDGRENSPNNNSKDDSSSNPDSGYSSKIYGNQLIHSSSTTPTNCDNIPYSSIGAHPHQAFVSNTEPPQNYCSNNNCQYLPEPVYDDVVQAKVSNWFQRKLQETTQKVYDSWQSERSPGKVNYQQRGRRKFGDRYYGNNDYAKIDHSGKMQNAGQSFSQSNALQQMALNGKVTSSFMVHGSDV